MNWGSNVCLYVAYFLLLLACICVRDFPGCISSTNAFSIHPLARGKYTTFANGCQYSPTVVGCTVWLKGRCSTTFIRGAFVSNKDNFINNNGNLCQIIPIFQW